MKTIEEKEKMNIEDIKKEVLNRIKESYRTIPEEKIIKWVNSLPSYLFEPNILIDEKEEIDVEQICGKKISEVIDFLSQYKDYILEYRWVGYEDNFYFMLVNRRPETLNEITKRICDFVDSDCRDFLKKEEQIADIDKEIRKLEDKKSKLREL